MSNSFSYELTWEQPVASGSAADATWGTLTVRIGDVVIWSDGTGGTASVRWTWVDLLESLAERWPWLRAEEGWPREVNAETPADIDGATRRALESCTEPERAKLAQTLFDYRWRHDLSRGLHGIALPELWFVREGHSAWIGSRTFYTRAPFEATLSALEKLGKEIAARLRGLKDERARDALRLWNNRTQSPLEQVLEVATGLSRPDLVAIAGDKLGAAFEMRSGDLNPTELVAFTRMASGRVQHQALRTILRAMRNLPTRPTSIIDALSQEVFASASTWRADRAFTEGYQLARWLRERLNYQDERAIDPLLLLRGWKISVKSLDFEAPEIDAVACWGPRHGPAVLLNTGVEHPSEARTRATLAHEIAHLLVDRRDALPLTEVMGGQVPEAAERRARAFAAELLLPRTVAGALFAGGSDPKPLMTRLCRRYIVSKEIVAWQTLNSDHALSPTTRSFLRRHVHPR